MFKEKADNYVVIEGYLMEIISITPKVCDNRYEEGYEVVLRPPSNLPKLTSFTVFVSRPTPSIWKRADWERETFSMKMKIKFLKNLCKEGEKIFKHIQRENEKMQKVESRRLDLEHSLEEILKT